MHLLLVMNLNDSLMRAKLVPLLRTGLVERITVVARRAGPTLPHVRYVVAPDHPRLWRRMSALLVTLLRTASRDRPDVVMAYNLVPFGILGLLAARLARVPFGLNIIGGAAEVIGGGVRMDSNRILARLREPSPALERLMVWLVKRADFVTTTGRRTSEFLVSAGVSPGVLHEIASAIDPDEFRPEPRSPRWDIVCISALYGNKRVKELVQLVSELVAVKPDLRVALVGAGPLEAEVASQIRRLGLERTVHLLGFQPDVREVLWSSRIFVMTSRAEGLPLSVIEAAACGVPVVVCDFGDVSDLIEDGVNGRVVPIEDLPGVRTALRELIGRPAERDTYAAAARDAVVARYTVAAAASKWRTLIATGLRKRPAP